MKKVGIERIGLICIAILALLGIIIDWITADGILGGLNLYNYYTIQSNSIVAVVFFLSFYEKDNHINRLLKYFQGGSIIWILVTGIVYHLMLSQIHNPIGWENIANLLLHYIVPISCFVYFIFINRRWHFYWKYPLLWTAYPVLYAIVSLIRGKIDGFYPYWFLNPDGSYPIGIGSMANLSLFFGGVVIIFIIFGYFMLGVKGVVLKIKETIHSQTAH